MTRSLKKARAYIALRQLLATILRQHVGCHMCVQTPAETHYYLASYSQMVE